MQDFHTKSYKNLLESHTQLNNYIKISTVAVDYLYNSEKNNEELSKHINELILKSGERWTPRIIKEPKVELSNLKNNLTKSAIIWVYSSFDVFFKQIEGMLSIHFTNSNNNHTDNPENDSDNKDHKVLELYKKLKWDSVEIQDLIFILKFYEALRHSVAHNLGEPSRKLIEASESEEFINAIKNWKTKFKKNTISPPPIVAEKTIELRPHHSILYSETCIRIAKDINKRLFDKIGLDYFVQKTIKNHLTDTDSLTNPICKNFTRYLVYHLKSDFNISISPYENIYNFYNDKQLINEHKKRYNSLKNNR